MNSSGKHEARPSLHMAQIARFPCGSSDFIGASRIGKTLAVMILLASPSMALGAKPLSPYSSKEAWQRAVPKAYQNRPRLAPAFVFVEADPKLPNVLILGGSNSIYCTVGVRKNLKGTANVFRAPDNCRSTRHTLKDIETFLGDVRWDVICFNWGMHDLTHLNDAGKAAPPLEGKHQVPPDQYRQNLRKLIDRLKKTGAKLIWATTLPVGSRHESRGFRRDVDVVAYNAAAGEIMKSEGVVVSDLYTLVKPRAEKLLGRDGIHFAPKGRAVLAEAVAGSIRKALEDPSTATRSAKRSALSPLARKLLGASEEQLAMLAQKGTKAQIEIAPVHLPEDSDGDCNHYGWPIATMIEDTIIVMHRQLPGHNPHGAGGPNEKMSYGIVLRSTDGGKTWSQPYDLRDCMKPEDRNRGGLVPLAHRRKFDKENKSKEGYKIHMHAIGTTRDGGVLAITDHGVFRSDDKGRTWKHFSKALRDDTFPHSIVNLGPRIIDHPQHGLLAFGNGHGKLDKRSGKIRLGNKLVVLSSPDGGAHWKVEEHEAGFPQYEPAVLTYEDEFLAVTRDQTKAKSHRQMTWRPGKEPVFTATNLENPSNVDTVDFSFNPRTKRFEVVRSERYRMELWLWSMNPKDWSGGQWRCECRLLAREGRFYRDADGFHPAGAVIDERRGVQHIFIYSGHSNGPAGVFRITRTLDTPRLVKAMGKAEHRKRQ